MPWTMEDDLRFAIQDAMRDVKLLKLGKRLEEDDRAKLARAIVDRFKLSGITVTFATRKPFSTHNA